MTELEMKAKLYQKIWAVMSEVGFVRKDGEIKLGETYKYATDAAIKKAVHPALVNNRLLFLPTQTQVVEQAAETITDRFGKPKREFRSTIELSYKFVDIDTGYSETASIHGSGSGTDEKSIYKAFTGAFKYIFHLALVIPTGDDPEKEELSKEEKKQARADGHAAQQAVADRKVAQIQAGTVPESWDWRIALPRFEKLEQHYGKTEVSIALKMAGFNSLEETPSREAALAAYEKVRATLAKAATEQPEWVEKPHSKPESKLEKAAAPLQGIASHLGLAKPADPLLRMLDRMGDFKGRLAVIQQHKFDLVQKYGEKEGANRYYEVLDKHSGHNDTHANEIAKNAEKSRFVASELYLELHPEEVEEEVTA